MKIKMKIKIETTVKIGGGMFNAVNWVFEKDHIHELNNNLANYFIEMGFAEELKEPEYTESDMIQFAQYCDTGRKHELPWYGAFLIGGNWRQK